MSLPLSTTLKLRLLLKPLHSHLIVAVVEVVVVAAAAEVINKLLLSLQHISIKTREIDEEEDVDGGLPVVDCSVLYC